MTTARRWVHRRQPGVAVGEETRQSYYGLPVIHGPHWRWSIVLYFVLGGLAGGSAVLSGIARLIGRREAQPIVRAGRYLSFLTALPAPLLLIEDLGRPERFHHMLRVLKLRSPMSLGVWGLIAFSGTAFLGALRQLVDDRFFGRWLPGQSLIRRVPDRALAGAQTVTGFFLAGYTGVLLGATAVPLWARNALLLGPLFLCSALSSAAATLGLLLRGADAERAHRVLDRVERAALLGECVLLEHVQRRSGPTVGRPLSEGHEGRAYRAARLSASAALGVGSLAAVVPRPLARPLRAAATLLALASAPLLRAAILFGGRRSADDPEATFATTRRG